jgi:hypothetical protein
MENGAELGIDTLYPFSQVTLAHVARVLGTYGIDVAEIGIPPRSPGRGCRSRARDGADSSGVVLAAALDAERGGAG